MPKRTDIEKILIIGAGPIVIGQACEFDYSGTQACKALKEEGYKVILLNSNPATIMTDPDFADRTYIEPVTPESWPGSLKRNGPTRSCPPWADRPPSTPPWPWPRTGRWTIRGRTDRRQAPRHREWPRTARSSSRRWSRSASGFPAAAWPIITRRPWRSSSMSAFRPSSALPSPSAEPAAASPITARNTKPWPWPASMPRPPARSWSRNRSSAGRSSSWRSCGTWPTTSSSSAPSRTSTPWGFIPAIPSPSPRPRP